MGYQIRGDYDASLDALLDVESNEIVVQSRGSNKGKPINPDYSNALRLILGRLSASAIPIVGAWVNSSRTPRQTALSDTRITRCFQTPSACAKSTQFSIIF